MPIYVLWFVAALGLLIVELHTANFFAVFLAAGAFAAGLVAFVAPDLPIWIPAVVAVVVAMAGVVVVRPFLDRRLRHHGEPAEMPGVHGGFVGQRALALDEIGDELHPGHVRLAGETWMAFGDGQPIETGAPVIVTAVRGTTLAVRPA
jgi:membrane protein implicated in regulation of membrane protease activity